MEEGVRVEEGVRAEEFVREDLRTMEGTKVGSLRGLWRERRWGVCEDDGVNEGGGGCEGGEDVKVGSL